MRASDVPIGQEVAESLAVQALAYLAEDPARFLPFLAASGIDPAEIRAAARAPGFLAGVLDHIAADERLILGFAEAAPCEPALVARARAALSGEAWLG